MDVLISKVKNILERKKQLWKYFDQLNTVKPDQAFSSTDEKFLKYLTSTIEENMHNQDFSIEKFSSQLGMDRFQLYRKIHSLTGLSPSKYVTRIRLNKALELLQKHKASVSEVAFEVGFNSSSYFSQCFKEIYGVKPSQYNEVILSRSVKEKT